MFLDDLNVHSLNQEEHLEHFCYTLLKLREVNLKHKLGECEFAKTNLVILGHVVSHDGI